MGMYPGVGGDGRLVAYYRPVCYLSLGLNDGPDNALQV